METFSWFIMNYRNSFEKSFTFFDLLNYKWIINLFYFCEYHHAHTHTYTHKYNYILKSKTNQKFCCCYYFIDVCFNFYVSWKTSWTSMCERESVTWRAPVSHKFSLMGSLQKFHRNAKRIKSKNNRNVIRSINNTLNNIF